MTFPHTKCNVKLHPLIRLASKKTRSQCFCLSASFLSRSNKLKHAGLQGLFTVNNLGQAHPDRETGSYWGPPK